MAIDGQKQLARQRREHKFRVWLTTLSWSLPVVAFGSFFSLWHDVSAATNSPTPQSRQTAGSAHSFAKKISPVLFKIGSTGLRVSAIQEQLSELGYFNHAITQYYGRVTAAAVKSFQTDHGLSATGQIDQSTLSALQEVARQSGVSSLTKSTTNDASSSFYNDQSSGTVQYSQQGTPVATSSAS